MVAAAGAASLLLHVCDHRRKLIGVLDFYKGRGGALSDNEYGWRPRQFALQPQVVIRLDLVFELALGIESERNRNLVLVGEFLEILQEVSPGDLRLVLIDVTAKIIAQLFRLGVQEACINRRLPRPGVLGKREVVQYHRHMAGVGSLPDLGISFGAGRALEILEDHNCHFRSYRRLELRTIGGEAGARRKENCQYNRKMLKQRFHMIIQ